MTDKQLSSLIKKLINLYSNSFNNYLDSENKKIARYEDLLCNFFKLKKYRYSEILKNYRNSNEPEKLKELIIKEGYLNITTYLKDNKYLTKSPYHIFLQSLVEQNKISITDFYRQINFIEANTSLVNELLVLRNTFNSVKEKDRTNLIYIEAYLNSI